MKIRASIPVEKTHPSPATISYRTDEMEVDVVRLVRYRADSTRERYYYMADVRCPETMHADCRHMEILPGTVRVNVIRALNPGWKPPKFTDGTLVLNID